MATTRIIPMHRNKGKTIAQCLRARTDYVKNPEKTNGGELISSFACDPRTVDAEFLLSKKEYQARTGRAQKRDVVAYQVRQSFRPGEVSPEEANRIGYEFASRFLKGNHAFIVATHVDKAHLHNHIVWNSTDLDCTRKFRNFWGSTKAVQRLSDTLCVEHGLSIIEQPNGKGMHYGKWLGNQKRPSYREQLREAIDQALAQKAKDFDALLQLLRESGYEVKAAFDTSLHCDDIRSEVQFGCIRRTVHRSTDIEKARFEICNHKYSDLSELNYGIALLNDCKYGISANEGSMRLSLHKGGIRPDIAGDKGRHICRYAILPHCEAFGAKCVVEPAYAFNYRPLIQPGIHEADAFVAVNAENVIIETIKPCEDTEQAYILRLYEATGDYTVAELTFAHPVKKLVLCNMLEEEETPLEKPKFTMKPFQICTVKVCY